MTEENMTVDWLYLPSVPFDIIMTKIAHESLTTLRNCMEVCSTWKKRILENPEVKDTIKNKMERAFGPEVSVDPGCRMLPTNEEIINAKWFSKFNNNDYPI